MQDLSALHSVSSTLFHAWSPLMVLLLYLTPLTEAFGHSELFATVKQKQERKRCPQSRASSRLMDHVSLPSTRLVPATDLCQKPCQHQTGIPNWHTDTCKRTQGSKVPTSILAVPLSLPCFTRTQAHSDYFCPHHPMDKSPHPFRVKTPCLWKQSSSSIASSTVKLFATEQPSTSFLLLQHCKRKKNVEGFLWVCWFGVLFETLVLVFYDEAATVLRKSMFCTHRKAHTYFIWCIASCTE